MRLKELRAAKGMTQTQLAEKVGLSLSMIAQIEQGGKSPSWKTAQSLARALGVTIGEFDKPSKVKRIKRGRPPKQQ